MGLHTSNWAMQMDLPRLGLARNHRMWLYDASPEPEKKIQTVNHTTYVKLKKGTYVHRSNSFPKNRSDMLNSPQAQLALHGRHTSVLVSKAVQAQDIRLSFFKCHINQKAL